MAVKDARNQETASRAHHGPQAQGEARYTRLEIRTDTLYSLINSRSLVVEDLRKLDRRVQRHIRRLLLDTLRL